MGSPEGDPAARPDTAESATPAAMAAGQARLRLAMRRARVEAAERSDVVAELRGAEIARLEMLEDALAPVLAAVPPGVDLFDAGLVLGGHPRLFVDMIAFVDMGRDPRLYRFHQDTRHGRIVIAESERLDTMVAAVTDYVARRLVEREKTLAALPEPSAIVERHADVVPPPQRRGRGLRRAFATLGFLVDLLGTAALVLLLLVGLWYAGTSLLAWVNRT